MQNFFARFLANFDNYDIVGLPTLPPEQFGEMFIAALTNLLPGTTCSQISEKVIVVAFEGIERPVGIVAAYNDYRAAPNRAKEIIDRLARSTLPTLSVQNPAKKKETILPALKAASFRKNIPLTVVSTPLNELFDIVLVDDMPTMMRYVNESDMQDFGMTSGELLNVALANLEKREHKVTILAGENQGLIALALDGTYEASCLLLPTLMQKVEKIVSGNLLAIAPSRDMVLLTGTRDADNILKGKIAAEKEKAVSRYALVSEWMIYDHGKWSIWVP